MDKGYKMYKVNDKEYKPFLVSNLKEFLVLRGIYDVEAYIYHYKLTLEIPATFDVLLKDMDNLPEILADVEKNLIFALENPEIFQTKEE